MNSLAAGIYSHEEMKRVLTGNRTIGFRYELLDRYEHPIGCVSATGSIDFNSSTEIKRVASFKIKEVSDIDFLNDRIKPYMRVKVGRGWVEYPLGVYLMDSPERAGGIGVSRNIDCYDKTVILRDDKFTARHIVRAGEYYTNAIKKVISSAGISNYNVESSQLTLQTDIEFEVGTSKLDAVNRLVKAINYNDVYVDVNGCVRVSAYQAPESRSVEEYYVTDKRSIVLPNAEESLDIFSAPNKIVRYLENVERGRMISVAINDDPASKLSTVSRGRTIVDAQAVNDIANQDTLDAYVQRIAAEKKVYQQLFFETALMPHHEYMDCIYIENKELGVSGKYIETAWNMKLEVGGTMRHTCKRTVSI